MKEWMKKWDLSAIYKVFLVLLDIVFVNTSSFLALWIRFNMYTADIPIEYYTSVKEMVIPNTIATLIVFAIFKLYTSLWRYASIKELVNIIEACVVCMLLNILGYYLTYRPIYRSYFVLYGASLFLLTCMSRFSYRLIRLLYRSNLHGAHMRNTMIIGAGEACNVVMKELELSTKLDSKLCCIIDDNPRKHGTYIHGVKVVGGRDTILENAQKYGITEIIIAIPSASKAEQRKILEICQKVPNCDLKILPGVYQLVNGDVTVSKLRHVEIEDLLGRDPVQITTEKIGRYVSDKVVLVTGGGGSIGSELCRQIAANGVRQLIIFDIYENNAYDIQQELRAKYPYLDLVVLIGSVRNGRKLNSVFAEYRPDIVYHAAAHKHVPLMEDSPNEAIKNNVEGTYKVAQAAAKYGVKKFVLISTDKAVNPTNIMGASKRLCEMVVQMMNRQSDTDFVAVRFGNVLGSNGSVIPLFKKQIAEGGPVTVTDKRIIRYFMTIPEAAQLVLQTGAMARKNELFVLNMGQPVKILDLAENMIRLSGYVPYRDIDIVETGLRPGEKLYEELLIASRDIEQTENSQIFIERQPAITPGELREKLEILQEALEKNDSSCIREALHRVVPTFHEPEEVNCGQGAEVRIPQQAASR